MSLYLDGTSDLLTVWCHRHNVELEVLGLLVLVVQPLWVPHPDDDIIISMAVPLMTLAASLMALTVPLMFT